ncbi:MAG: pyridoxal phosphate-dependent aminotransferase family protein [Maribacter sp.]|nr:pyridoxal phosphate-dependent aminotransferase family protein [Maribacter sp.]
MIHYIDRFPDREILDTNRKYLYFGGTAYLGLQTDNEFQAFLINNIRKYGSSYGASRNSNVRFSIFEEVEHYLAKLVGSSACTTMSSGYLAAQLLVQYFCSPTYKLFYAPHTHTALFSTKQKSYATFTALNIAIRQHLEIKKGGIPILLMDSVDFSGGNYPDFSGLRSLPLDKIVLVIDDSHGIGILGENGRGVYGLIKKMKPKELLVCCSLGKGLGIQAGAIFGNQTRIEELKRSEFFGGASPPSPAFLATLMDSKTLINKKRIQLIQNISFFWSHLRYKKEFITIDGHPGFSFMNTGLADYLENQEIIITNFNYPTDHSGMMQRIVISSNHAEHDILRLAACINEYYSNSDHGLRDANREGNH